MKLKIIAQVWLELLTTSSWLRWWRGLGCPSRPLLQPFCCSLNRSWQYIYWSYSSMSTNRWPYSSNKVESYKWEVRSEKWNRKASDCFWSSYAVYWWRSCQYQSVTMQRTLLDSTRLDCRLISLYYWEPGKLSAPSLFLFWHSKFSDFWRSKNTIKLENYFYCLLFRPGLACFPNSSWHHPLNKITQQCLQSFRT